MTNAPELTVSELSGALKRAIEDQFGHVRLRGEISNYRGPHSSGHAYFCLKDASARIDAVIWKGVFSRLRTKPQEGLEVIATGKVTTFPGKSSYQIVIEQLEPAGLGALMALLEERRKKFAAEGFFDEARKKKIPFLPTTIGIVTSPTGAVIRDILHRLHDRFPRHVLVWPVRVQGETSAAEVANAIRGFNALPQGGKIPRPDLLIVARGGGSLEDLWSFNEEEVLRAAAASRIPLIAAVGHETDWTLLDLVADLRAPTPTGAAEKAVPVRAELLSELGRSGAPSHRRDFPQRGAAAQRDAGAGPRVADGRRAAGHAAPKGGPGRRKIAVEPVGRARQTPSKPGAGVAPAGPPRAAGRTFTRHRAFEHAGFPPRLGSKKPDREAAGATGRTGEKFWRCEGGASQRLAREFAGARGAASSSGGAARCGHVGFAEAPP